MLDSGTIVVSMLVSFGVAFGARIISQDIGKLFAILSAMPFIIFILSAVNSGMTIHDISNLNLWITAFVSNVIPILLILFSEGAGEELARKLRG